MTPKSMSMQLLPDTSLEQLKDVIQDLYQIMIQVATYDTTGRPGRDVLSEELYENPHSPSSSSSSSSFSFFFFLLHPFPPPRISAQFEESQPLKKNNSRHEPIMRRNKKSNQIQRKGYNKANAPRQKNPLPLHKVHPRSILLPDHKPPPRPPRTPRLRRKRPQSRHIYPGIHGAHPPRQPAHAGESSRVWRLSGCARAGDFDGDARAEGGCGEGGGGDGREEDRCEWEEGRVVEWEGEWG
ncbi:hypothetical protein E4U50_006731 [Claviceps purpurea]|nr:hypothetical protein E4U50_006731 [Claviceps purpurea]